MKDIVIFNNSQNNQKKDKEVTKIQHLAQMTERRLFKASTIFPFDFFPNKIYVEEKQVIMVYSQFFFTSQDYHILIEDILMPVVEQGIFFATLRLEMGPGGYQQNPPPVNFLNKKDAQRLKQIIIGLLICHKEKIDLSKMSTEQILEHVEEIGRTKTN